MDPHQVDDRNTPKSYEMMNNYSGDLETAKDANYIAWVKKLLKLYYDSVSEAHAKTVFEDLRLVFNGSTAFQQAAMTILLPWNECDHEAEPI